MSVVKPAAFDLQSGLITPTMRSVSFNGAIQSDDGLLANSVARRSGLKYEAARERMQHDITRLKQRLERDGRLVIGRIGMLSLNDEGRTLFTPRLSAEKLMRELGCPALSLSKATATQGAAAAKSMIAWSARNTTGEDSQREESTRDERVNKERVNKERVAKGNETFVSETENSVSDSRVLTGTPVDTATVDIHRVVAAHKESRHEDASVEVVAETPVMIPTMFGRRPISERNFYVAINRNFARVSAAVVFVIATAIAFVLSPYTQDRAPVEASVLPVKQVFHQYKETDNRPGETIIKCETISKGETASSEKVEIAESAETPASKEIEMREEEGVIYHLVVATFHKESDAAEYIAKATDGAKMRDIVSGRTHRISLTSSRDRTELIKELNSDGLTVKYPGAWIWAEK